MRPGTVALAYALVGVLYIGIGIPLMRGRVRPNAWYGFRTAKTFSSTTIWYQANRVAGIDLIIAGLLIIVGAIALLLVRSYFAPGFRSELWTFGLFVVSMVGIAIHSFWALGRM
jgi:uncharacterized membrane protein